MRRDVPMFFGNPNQFHVKDTARLQELIEMNNGRNDCYWSHNAVSADRSKVLLRYIPFDFDFDEGIGRLDDPESLEKPRQDLLRLRAWAKERGMDVIPVFSGGKGFHGYLEFKPVLAEAGRGLQALYKGIQLTAVEEAGLETADPHLHGDHQRILRIPGTMHMTSGLFCNELKWAVVGDGVDACIRFARSPQKTHTRAEPPSTAPEWMKAQGIEPRQGGSGYGPSGGLTEYHGGDALLRNLLPRMCIHNSFMQKNVPHVVRFEAALTLARSGFGPDDITRVFLQAGREYGWFKINRAVTETQSFQIWRNKDTYKIHSCGRLRSEGLCVGKICPRFKEVFGDDDDE